MTCEHCAHVLDDHHLWPARSPWIACTRCRCGHFMARDVWKQFELDFAAFSVHVGIMILLGVLLLIGAFLRLFQRR